MLIIEKAPAKLTNAYLNTTLVNVNRKLLGFINQSNVNLNTTLVNVNP